MVLGRLEDVKKRKQKPRPLVAHREEVKDFDESVKKIGLWRLFFDNYEFRANELEDWSELVALEQDNISGCAQNRESDTPDWRVEEMVPQNDGVARQ